MSRPLEGIRIIELGTHVAVPNATRMMADWGAEVIKVEGLEGDLWRYAGHNLGCPVAAEENPVFTMQNANKQVVSINLKEQEGVALLLEMLQDAAGFITNVRYPSLEKLGLDYDSLKDRFPSLVYFHFTGYGYEGPLAQNPGFDAAAYWAIGGMLLDWVPEGSSPLQPAYAFGDSTVANGVLSGFLAALLSRERTGKGQRVTTSLYANALWYNGSDVLATQPRFGLKRPVAHKDAVNPFVQSYQCGDGEWILICILEFDRGWRGMMPMLGLGEYVENPDYCTPQGYAAHRDELYDKLCAAFRSQPAAYWQKVITEANFVCMRMGHAKEAYQSEQAWANGYLEEVTFPNGNKAVLPKTPIRFFDGEAKGYEPTGGIGCHSEAVLTQMGYSSEQIKDMKARNIIRFE